jgi:hypothetical protein
MDVDWATANPDPHRANSLRPNSKPSSSPNRVVRRNPEGVNRKLLPVQPGRDRYPTLLST